MLNVLDEITHGCDGNYRRVSIFAESLDGEVEFTRSLQCEIALVCETFSTPWTGCTVIFTCTRVGYALNCCSEIIDALERYFARSVNGYFTWSVVW